MAGIFNSLIALRPSWVTRLRSFIGAFKFVSLVVLAVAVNACKTAPVEPTATSASFNPSISTPSPKPGTLTLREGDIIRVAFPGAPNLDTTRPIRRDGMITLPIVGEFKAAGLTPSAMEKDLLALYGPQLQSKEVTVSLESASFAIFVSGAVRPYLRPTRRVTMGAGSGYRVATLIAEGQRPKPSSNLYQVSTSGAAKLATG